MTAAKRPARPSAAERIAQQVAQGVRETSHASATSRPDDLPTPTAELRAAEKPASKPRATTPTPEGMTRRSIYTHKAALDELLAAADRVVRRSGGVVTKADAIAGLLVAGAGHEAEVA